MYIISWYTSYDTDLSSIVLALAGIHTEKGVCIVNIMWLPDAMGFEVNTCALMKTMDSTPKFGIFYLHAI